MKTKIVWLAWAVLIASTAMAGEVGYVEEFALAKDRTNSLRQLIPGTEDYYYYHCLHFLNTEQYEKAEEMTRPWLERFGQTPRLIEIQTRHALLAYERNPQRSLDYLKNKLGLRFDHERIIPGEAPNLPTRLDPNLIARETLRTSSFARWGNSLDNFEDSALDWLAGANLDWERRRNLLQRLTRPDVPNLPKLVDQDLRSQHAPDFGAYPIHRQMTLAQLEELLQLRPNLLNHSVFVQAWLAKLHPSADENWRIDPAVTRAYLDRLLGFVRRLNQAHNALKANILYQRLVFDRTQGVFDKALFLEYLKLPRMQHYMPRPMLERADAQRYPADLNADFSGFTMLPPIHSDEPLVRSYLKHFLATADSAAEFAPYINDVYLRHLFAEVKIENGLGEPEQWASQLPPELFRALKERIDIDFAYTNKANFTTDEPVELNLYVKNVPTLTVKVFEVNALNYYRQYSREVDTDLNLDGLVAGVEQVHPYGEPPLRRVARKFALPQINKPGVYVVDFIGSGKSSRALIRKGRLRPVITMSTAGQVVTVVDDAGKQVKDANLWLGGQEFHPDKDGTTLVPFSTSPGRKPIVISRGDFASLDHLNHQAENYSLAAGIHVDREALLTSKVAPVVVRPGVFINGQPVSVKLLEEVKLRLTATDMDGIATSTEIPNFALFEDRESVHEFRVPPRLANLSVSLMAKVKSLSLNRQVDLAASAAFALNGIDKTDKIEDLHLAKFGPNYVIEVRGRTGESRVDRPVQLAIKHRDYREPVQVTLKSDATGRVHLGPLADITTVNATGPAGIGHVWQLPTDQFTYRSTVHAKAGETVTLPYLGTAAAPVREEVALFELRGDLVKSDRFDALAIKDGLLELRGLVPGDYDLVLKRVGVRVRVRIADGPVVENNVLGRVRHLELPGLKPVQIASVTPSREDIAIRLVNPSPFTRVHVFATRYLPEYSAFADLGAVRDAELSGTVLGHAQSVYLAGRNIGDEYRYVLDRQQQKKYPGNMLDRPALLLNPWAIRTTATGEQLAESGEDFGRRGEADPSMAQPPAPRTPVMAPIPPEGGSPNLDFLADASAVVLNLVPDKDGVVKLARKDVGPHAMIHVVAVDPLHTTYRSAALPEQPASFADLRLSAGLDPSKHYTLQKQISVLPQGQPFVLNDIASSRFEAYDSLAKVYALYATLSKDPKLAEFAFVLNWPNLKPEEKRTLYSKYACHELHFFLLKKDPAFYREVVRPYLANKRDKTFLDRWLLDEGLDDYNHPWAHGRLNTAERVLLAQRLPGEPAKTARHINDLLRLRPQDLDRFRTLFDTAVQSGSLGADDNLGYTKAKDAAKRALEAREQYGAPLMQGAGVPVNGLRGSTGTGVVPSAPAAMPMKPRAMDEVDKGGEGKEQTPAMLKTRDGSSGKKQEKGSVDARRGIYDFDGSVRGGEANFFEDRRKNAQLRQLYRRLDPTQEWAENNYYKLLIQQQVADLVPVGPYWLDYAKNPGQGSFLSRNLADSSRNFTEMMLALSVLDLPFEAGKHDVKFDGGKMTLTPAGPTVAFHEEVKPAGNPPAQSPILVTQNFYRHGDRYREEEGEKLDKFLTGEYVVHTVYGGHVVVTNPTSAKQKLAVLLQVPVGAVPVAGAQYTKTVLFDLEPYRTQTVDYLFYFPAPGTFPHFPVHVAKNEQLMAAAQPVSFNVVAKPTKLDTGSWDYLSQNGSPEQVMSFLARENVQALDLEKIAFRMKDRGFFEAVIGLLTERHAYHQTLWSYGLLHNATPVVREFLLHNDQIVGECGGPIQSPLLVVDPVARHAYQHLEYKPLVNARAHSLGTRRQIVNDRLLEQYHHYLKQLTYQRQLRDDDKLAAVYYLLLQDRIEEALAAFAEVSADHVAEKMQYEYCAAYLDFFSDSPQKARAIAAKYAQHPVDRWRHAFTVILNQLDEAEGKGAKVADAESRNEQQGALAATEPNFEFHLDAKKINLTWQNVDAVRVNYYLMDVELLFSRNPFAQQVGGPFTSVRPNTSHEVKLPAGQKNLTVPLPEDLAQRNVLVEVTAAGKTRALPYYAGSMNVQLTESYGQLRVADGSGKPQPKVYVKVYARLADGQVKFHKDGYTDYRGRFDYASVSTPEKAPVGRFAVLVLSGERGAVIREATPPAQ